MKTNSLLKEYFFTHGKLNIPIIDLHGHMGTWSGIFFDDVEVSGMLSAMEHSGITLQVFCHHNALFSPDIGNRENIECVRKYPKKLKAYCGLIPSYPDQIRKEVETFEKYKDVYVGFKFLADYHSIAIDSEAFRPAWEYAHKNKLVCLVHTWGDSLYDGPANVFRIAEKYTGCKILLAHAFHNKWEIAVEAVRKFDNIYLDLCAVLDDRGVTEKFCKEAGSDRITFGCDFPWFDYNYHIGAVLGANITDEDRKNIFYRNAEKLLGIDK